MKNIETINPRPYQSEAIELLRDKFRSGARALLLVLSGGAGKTIIASMLLKETMNKGTACLFIAHRRELISQAQNKFAKYGIPSGIIMGSIKEDKCKDIQVASIKTLMRRELPPAKLVIIDEAHRSLGKAYKDIVEHYKNNGAMIIGLTGTPFRTNKNEALKDVFDDYVSNINCSDLISNGWLTPAKVVGVPSFVSTKGMKTSKGDFSDIDLMKAFDTDNVYLNLIKNYEKWGKGKKAIMFCCSVEHSIKCVEVLNENGYKSAHIDANTPSALRDEIIKDYNIGEIKILSNYGILAEGFDVPDTEIIIFNTATQSKIKWLQACWRGSRLAEGKSEYIVIDMADNCEKRFGYPDIDIEVSLDAQSDREEKLKGLAPCKMCKSCYVILPVSARACKECGYEFPIKKVKAKEYDFVELDRDSKYRKWNSYTRKDWDKVEEKDLEEFASFKKYKPMWVRLEKERRAKGYKFVKLENWNRAKDKEYYDICNVLQKKYYEKKLIDAHQFVFIKETSTELIFKYTAEENGIDN